MNAREREKAQQSMKERMEERARGRSLRGRKRERRREREICNKSHVSASEYSTSPHDTGQIRARL